MKKILFILLLILVLIRNIQTEETKKDELRGIFISYIELNEYIKSKDQTKSKKNIAKMINNIKDMHCNTIILQVRIASDAIYHSNIFPTSMYIVEKEGDSYYDVLEYFIKKSHEKKIKVYAWINPYRVRTTENTETISPKNPAYQFIGTDTLYIKEGIYYNPSKDKVTELIVEGVKEVLDYEIDGLLFDDYFYPNNEIDRDDYEEYIKNNKMISKEEYNLKIINNMIKKVYKECQKKNIPFGISPDGNIENNYQKNYADVKKWLKEDGYIDFIMPQIYYGFYNSTQGYTKVTEEWESILLNDKIKLYIALAFYKVGTEDKYAKEGINEWLNNEDIIMREIILSRNLRNYQGFSLFRYDSIFKEETYTTTSIKEIENMKKLLN